VNEVVARVRRSFGHRPWTVDVGSGATTMYWGLWVAFAPQQLEQPRAFDFLNAIDPYCVAALAIVLGMSQLVAALINVFWWRWFNALFALTLYSFIAFGIIESSPTPAVAVYSGLGFMNVMILARIF
jgi:hypothetical protein